MLQTPKTQIRVVVVDDSPTVRNFLASILTEAGMNVIATGNDGRDAVRLVTELRPDVLTLDIRMPNMDGFEATRRIMREQPTPIVIVSGSMKYHDVELTFQALQAGALAVLKKPGLADPQTCEKVVQTVQAMSGVRVIHHWGTRQNVPPKPKATLDGLTPRLLDISRYQDLKVIGIASSTGGPSALAAVLGDLPANYPLPILVVQHVSPGFTTGLVEWLGSVTKMQVDVAAHGERLKPGTIAFAPDDYHLQVTRSGEIELSRDPAYKGLRPSANPLFGSLARYYGKKSMGIILTGMGDDGANGMELLHQAGGLTIAQEKESCVVYGMPKEAVIRNAVDAQMNPREIASFLKYLGEAKMNLFKLESGVL
jgi:two-component system chemotaxis response regulator CheB